MCVHLGGKVWARVCMCECVCVACAAVLFLPGARVLLVTLDAVVAARLAFWRFSSAIATMVIVLFLAILWRKWRADKRGKIDTNRIQIPVRGRLLGSLLSMLLHAL